MIANFGSPQSLIRLPACPTKHDARGISRRVLRRTLAYFVDLCIIGVLAAFAGVVLPALGRQLWTAGAGVVVSVWPYPACLSYAAAERPMSATLGMRLFDVELRR